MSVLSTYFGWPSGQIWPNLIASAICTAIVWWRLHRRSVVHHAEQLALIARLHFERTDQAEKHADEIKRQLTVHCGDLKDHITQAASVPPITVHVQAPDPEQAAEQVASQLAGQLKRQGRRRM